MSADTPTTRHSKGTVLKVAKVLGVDLLVQGGASSWLFKSELKSVYVLREAPDETHPPN